MTRPHLGCQNTVEDTLKYRCRQTQAHLLPLSQRRHITTQKGLYLFGLLLFLRGGHIFPGQWAEMTSLQRKSSSRARIHLPCLAGSDIK